MTSSKNSSGQVFEVLRYVRHGHTDPAGIVYYPRYYEMINESIEDLFRDVIGRPFGKMHLKDRKGIPTVRMETDFLKPSFCDDTLIFRLQIQKLGTASMTFIISATCGDEVRLKALAILVHMNMDTMKSEPFDDDLRDKLSQFKINDIDMENE